MRRAWTSLGRSVTPLVIGYVWLVLVWLLVRPHLPNPKVATGSTATIYEVVTTLGKYLSLLIASVLAYMIGWLTVRVLLGWLVFLPVPPEARTIYLRWPDLADQKPSYGNFRPERTAPYVQHGILPPELYRLDRFPDEFKRLCSEVALFWAAPVSLAALGLGLTFLHSIWWALPTAMTPLLMFMGYTRYKFACRLLAQAAVAQADLMHAAAAQEWANARVRVAA